MIYVCIICSLCMRAYDCMTLTFNSVLSVESHQWLLNISNPSQVTAAQLQQTARSYSLESDTLKCSWNSATKEMSAIQKSALLPRGFLSTQHVRLWMGKTQVVNGGYSGRASSIRWTHFAMSSFVISMCLSYMRHNDRQFYCYNPVILMCLLQIFHHSFENESEMTVPPAHTLARTLTTKPDLIACNRMVGPCPYLHLNILWVASVHISYLNCSKSIPEIRRKEIILL